MDHRFLRQALAAVLLAATPALLTLPGLVPGIDPILPFLAAVASFYLGLQFSWGDLADL